MGNFAAKFFAEKFKKDDISSTFLKIVCYHSLVSVSNDSPGRLKNLEYSNCSD